MPRTKYMVAFGLYALLKNEEGMSRCLEINKHSVTFHVTSFSHTKYSQVSQSLYVLL